MQDVRTRACAPSATSAAAASRVTRIALAGARAAPMLLSAHARAWAALFFCERQPLAYSLCLLSSAGQSKSAPLCMLHTIFMVSCGLKFFFSSFWKCTHLHLSALFFPKKGLGFIGFAIRNVLSINLPVIWTMSASNTNFWTIKFLSKSQFLLMCILHQQLLQITTNF